MPGELYQIYVNKAAINEKRTAIKGSGFKVENCYYWSSREYTSDFEYGFIPYDGYIKTYDKDYSSIVLGFLALEV